MVRRILLILFACGILGMAGCHSYYANPYPYPYYYGYDYYYEPGGYYDYRDYRIVKPDDDADDQARPPRDQIAPGQYPRGDSSDGPARPPRGGSSDGPRAPRGGSNSSGGRAPRSG